jgi:hypothetical protein
MNLKNPTESERLGVVVGIIVVAHLEFGTLRVDNTAPALARSSDLSRSDAQTPELPAHSAEVSRARRAGPGR